MLGLLTWDLLSSFFSFRRDDLDLEGLSLRERKINFRESLDGRLGSLGGNLGGRFGGLGRKPWEES